MTYSTTYALQASLDPQRKKTLISVETNSVIIGRYYEECANDGGEPEKKCALMAADELLSTDFTMYYNHQSDAEARHGRSEHKDFCFVTRVPLVIMHRRQGYLERRVGR
jgi:hypothetical protein